MVGQMNKVFRIVLLIVLLVAMVYDNLIYRIISLFVLAVLIIKMRINYLIFIVLEVLAIGVFITGYFVIKTPDNFQNALYFIYAGMFLFFLDLVIAGIFKMTGKPLFKYERI